MGPESDAVHDNAGLFFESAQNLGEAERCFACALSLQHNHPEFVVLAANDAQARELAQLEQSKAMDSPASVISVETGSVSYRGKPGVIEDSVREGKPQTPAA